jgi:spore coat protein U-like protein
MIRSFIRFAAPISLGVLAASLAALGGESKADAATATSNMTVSATVSASCTISAGALAFGAYDPVSTNRVTPRDASATLAVACTAGSPAYITLGQGTTAASGSTNAAPLRQMNDGGSNVLAYDLFSDTTRLVVWGNTGSTTVAGTGLGITPDGTSQNIPVFGRIPAGQNVPAGTYGDTVVATVQF